MYHYYYYLFSDNNVLFNNYPLQYSNTVCISMDILFIEVNKPQIPKYCRSNIWMILVTTHESQAEVGCAQTGDVVLA